MWFIEYCFGMSPTGLLKRSRWLSKRGSTFPSQQGFPRCARVLISDVLRRLLLLSQTECNAFLKISFHLSEHAPSMSLFFLLHCAPQYTLVVRCFLQFSFYKFAPLSCIFSKKKNTGDVHIWFKSAFCTQQITHLCNQFCLKLVQEVQRVIW